MKFIEDKDLWWITQYAENVSDEGVYEVINWKIKNSDEEDRQAIVEQILNLIENMSNLDDEINKKIYNKLMSDNLFSLSKLEDINEFFDKLDYEEVEEVANYFSLDNFDEFLEKEGIISDSSLEELIDISLKEKGLDSYYINLVEPWRNSTAEYVVVNGHVNGFSDKYSKDEVQKAHKNHIIKQFIDELKLG
ncbi:Mbov_0392 family ICE element protein [Mycoplasma capricolum]|uniref:Mbov_0392 family ICE element protein n=1 Tax=Mycoplasma capricolum TaxID=2095 RepID=UPI003DA488B5